MDGPMTTGRFVGLVRDYLRTRDEAMRAEGDLLSLSLSLSERRGVRHALMQRRRADMSREAWCFWMVLGVGGCFGTCFGSASPGVAFGAFGAFAVAAVGSFWAIQRIDTRDRERRWQEREAKINEEGPYSC